MRRTIPCAVAALGLILVACGAAAAQETDACAAFKWSIAREKTALAAPDLPTVASGQNYPGLGAGVTVALAPEAGVAYTVKPARPPKNNPSYGAELKLADAGPGGTVAVTLSEDAWVDVVQGGKVLRSTGFAGKAGCAGVRKSVRFKVSPGPLAIAISNAPTPAIKMDVTRAE